MVVSHDVVRFLGSWRWLVAKDVVIMEEDVARAFGINSAEAQAGVKSWRFANAIHPDDRAAFYAAVEKASLYAGEINFGYRLIIDGVLHRVEVSGSCVRARRSGGPAEYLGALHVHVEMDEHPLSASADHLISAAKLARAAGEKSLCQFIDMALVEAGVSLAVLEQKLQKAKPQVVIAR
jgi:hypothetical protein